VSTFVAACGTDVCGNRLIDEISSPDGAHIASVFERNCGATTPYVEIVSLRSAKVAFEPENDSDWVFTIHGRSAIDVTWIDNATLHVVYSATGDQPTKRVEWNGIAISYE
jgi:hypothetical protein